MYYAYILRNPEGKLYKGPTENIVNRLAQHNSGQFPSYTRTRGLRELVYSEKFETRKEAEAREKFFKSGKGREFLKKVIK